MPEIVEIEIEMDDGSIRKGFAKVKAAGQESANQIEQSFGKMSGLIKTALTALAGAFALHKIVEAGVESEKAWRGFALALASTGQFSQEAVKSFDEYANKLSKITGVQDEVIASGAAMLLNIGRLSTTELPRATQAALNLAAALPQIGGPEGAFNLMAKAAAGSTSALGRFGIHIDDTLKKGEKFNAVLNLIEKNFHNTAAAGTKTFEGMQNFANMGFGEIVKQMGLLITKSPAVIGLLKMVGDAFFNLAERIKHLGGGKDPLKPLLDSTVKFGQGVVIYIIGPLEKMFNIGSLIFKYFLAGLKAIAAAAGMVGQGVIMILQAVGVEVSQKLMNDVNTFTEQATQGVMGYTAAAEDSMLTLNNTPMSDSMNTFLEGMDAVILKSSDMQTSYSAHVTNMAGATTAFVDESVMKLKQLNEAVTRTIVMGISGAVQSMVKNLHAGKGAFDNFGVMIMGLIGDVAIQIGEFFLLAGTGLIALISNPLTAGFTTVAMGVALIAFGALMKSMSGGAPSMPSGGGLDSGGGIGSSPSSVPDQSDDLEKEVGKTEVTVVVQGNIFDRRETGLQIAEILNENFDLNGTRIETGVG